MVPHICTIIIPKTNYRFHSKVVMPCMSINSISVLYGLKLPLNFIFKYYYDTNYEKWNQTDKKIKISVIIFIDTIS